MTGLSVSAAACHDRLDLLQVVDVERGQAVAVLGGVVEELAHRDQGHGVGSPERCSGERRFYSARAAPPAAGALHSASICSSERPLVSGTRFQIQMPPTTQKNANSQNVPDSPIASTSVRKNSLDEERGAPVDGGGDGDRASAHAARKDFVDDRPHDRSERERERDDEDDERDQRDDARRGRSGAAAAPADREERGADDGEAHAHADESREQQRPAPEPVDERDGDERGQHVDARRSPTSWPAPARAASRSRRPRRCGPSSR